ncbi:MAG TPA: hypothetical protein ENI23_15910 [bacterium]|nr:hypothetical protein [bacterium]
MMLILGIILGLIIAFMIISIELIFEAKNARNITKIIREKIASKHESGVKFFDQPDRLGEAREEIMEKGKKEGRDIPIQELGL